MAGSDTKRDETDDDLIADCKARFAIAADVHEPNRRAALDDIRFARLASSGRSKSARAASSTAGPA
jgi:hypothetical protein